MLRVSCCVVSIDSVREANAVGEVDEGDETHVLLLSATPEVLGSTCTDVEVETKIPVVGNVGTEALAPARRRTDFNLRLGGLPLFVADGDVSPVSNGTGLGCDSSNESTTCMATPSTCSSFRVLLTRSARSFDRRVLEVARRSGPMTDDSDGEGLEGAVVGRRS